MGAEVSASGINNIIIRSLRMRQGNLDSDKGHSAFNMGDASNIILDHCSVEYCLWVSAHNRQPLSKDDTQYINNVVYNYQAAYTSGNTGGYFSHDIIGNYFITGPSSTTAKNAYYQMDSDQSVYASGNYLDDNKDGVLNGSPYNTVGSATVLSKPWASGSSRLATLSAAEAVTYVLGNAGALPRDELDTFVVSQVQSYGTKGTLYKSQTSTGVSNGGYGTL